MAWKYSGNSYENLNNSGKIAEKYLQQNLSLVQLQAIS